MLFGSKHEAHITRDGVKNGKGRIVWDGSTKISPLDVVLNDYTPVDNEPEVTFGTAKMISIG